MNLCLSLVQDWSGYLLKLELRRAVREERRLGISPKPSQPTQSSTRVQVLNEAPKLLRVRFLLEEEAAENAVGSGTAGSETDSIAEQQSLSGAEERNNHSDASSLTGADCAVGSEAPLQGHGQEHEACDRPVRLRLQLFLAPKRPPSRPQPLPARVARKVSAFPEKLEPSPVETTIEGSGI